MRRKRNSRGPHVLIIQEILCVIHRGIPIARHHSTILLLLVVLNLRLLHSLLKETLLMLLLRRCLLLLQQELRIVGHSWWHLLSGEHLVMVRLGIQV